MIALAAACAGVVATSGDEATAREPSCRPYDPAKDPKRAPWATRRQATLLVDSVLLSAYPGVRRAMPCWHLAKRGRPALMIRIAERELSAAGRRVSPVVVVGIGYNSLWERDRRNYATWAARFDDEAERLVTTLKRLGAQQIVWVTLREPRPSTVPGSAVGELRQYSWYFPYVNARLRRLAERHRDVVLANWTTASNRPGVTYDSIHCNTKGALLMGRLIKRTIEDEARRQARAGG
ncbi:MAG: hypothetical protein QOE31_1160 [Solirubrobacteraceae bacterium]|nr:hypothetical protein [Solirubrobacteraceae bacterium]